MEIEEYKCKMCGECCRHVPCEIIPKDLPKLLERFNMSFKEFFIKYLIAIPCNTGDKADTILRLSPARKINGHRFNKYLEDEEYMDYIDKGGECIFLQNNKCTIHDIKPFGGRIMKCSKMTGGLTLQLTNSQYFIYWYNNQKIFYELSNDIKNDLKEIESLYKLADEKYEEGLKNNDSIKIYKEYVKKADDIIKNKLKYDLNKLGNINNNLEDEK